MLNGKAQISNEAQMSNDQKGKGSTFSHLALIGHWDFDQNVPRKPRPMGGELHI
jgi:hypothetical protein